MAVQAFSDLHFTNEEKLIFGKGEPPAQDGTAGKSKKHFETLSSYSGEHLPFPGNHVRT